jgi:hypothetical protein
VLAGSANSRRNSVFSTLPLIVQRRRASYAYPVPGEREPITRVVDMDAIRDAGLSIAVETTPYPYAWTAPGPTRWRGSSASRLVRPLGPVGIAVLVLLMGVLALPAKAVLLLRAALVGVAAAGVLIVGGSYPARRAVLGLATDTDLSSRVSVNSGRY